MSTNDLLEACANWCKALPACVGANKRWQCGTGGLTNLTFTGVNVTGTTLSPVPSPTPGTKICGLCGCGAQVTNLLDCNVLANSLVTATSSGVASTATSTSTNTTDNNSSNDGKGSNLGLIVGLGVGLFIVACIGFGVVVVWLRMRRNAERRQEREKRIGKDADGPAPVAPGATTVPKLGDMYLSPQTLNNAGSRPTSPSAYPAYTGAQSLQQLSMHYPQNAYFDPSQTQLPPQPGPVYAQPEQPVYLGVPPPGATVRTLSPAPVAVRTLSPAPQPQGQFYAPHAPEQFYQPQQQYISPGATANPDPAAEVSSAAPAASSSAAEKAREEALAAVESISHAAPPSYSEDFSSRSYVCIVPTTPASQGELLMNEGDSIMLTRTVGDGSWAFGTNLQSGDFGAFSMSSVKLTTRSGGASSSAAEGGSTEYPSLPEKR
ncbi:hypothetical protein BJ742DRAFT_806647 [Cladochytrium replicatum]|nr:hypothetical protein BJ742DRAFT_806647 [Cladochytrium replicatum]